MDVGGGNPVDVKTPDIRGRWRREPLAHTSVSKRFFLFLFFFSPVHRNIATTSGYIASPALKEGASNHIVGRETHTIGVYIYVRQ